MIIKPLKNNKKLKEVSQELLKKNKKLKEVSQELLKKNKKFKYTERNLLKKKNFANLSFKIQNKIKLIDTLKSVYFTLGELTEKKRNEFKAIIKKKIIDFKNICSYLRVNKQNIVTLKKKNIIINDTFNKNLNTYYLYRDIPNKLFLKKFSNLLMINGKRNVAMKILLKLFEILKLKFRISDPIMFLKFYIFKNLVPVIQSKTVGFNKKKVIGISLSIFKRIGISLKLFIKGARIYNYPIVLGLLVEFLKIMRNKSYLQICNKKTLIDIKANKLYKFLNIEPKYILPENKFLSSYLKNTKKNMVKSFSLVKLMQIDWRNFDKIYKILIRRNNKNRIKRQKLILEAIKEDIMNKYPKKKQQIFYFKKKLKVYLHDFILKSLVDKDFKHFFKGKNPKNINLDFDFKRFRNNAIINKIFKTYYVWREIPKYFHIDENNELNING